MELRSDPEIRLADESSKTEFPIALTGGRSEGGEKEAEVNERRSDFGESEKKKRDNRLKRAVAGGEGELT